MFALLLLDIARAYSICQGASITEMTPPPGSADVPVDAAIGLISDLGSCDASPVDVRVSITATDADGNLTFGFEDVTIGMEHRVAWLEGALQPDTEYLVEGPFFEVGFHTGSGATEPLEGAPGGGSLALEYDRRAELFRIEAPIAPVANPYGPSVVALVDRDDADRIFGAALAPDDAGIVVTGEMSSAEPPDEVCVRAAQWDTAGRLLDLGPSVCADTGIGGCSTSPGPASAALLALSLLTVRRRKVAA